MSEKTTSQIRYGTLEEAGALRDNSSKIATGIKAGNINIESESVPVLDVGQDSFKRNNKVMAEFERRKRARMINVSTDDSEVKAQLRFLSEPIILFGEDPAERRERLRYSFSVMPTEVLEKFGLHKSLDDHVASQKNEELNDVTWYHEGPESLKDARIWTAKYSLSRAKLRLQRAKDRLQEVTEAKIIARKQELHKSVMALSPLLSQVADNRPISSCHFSPDSKLLATSSWSGQCKLWNSEDGTSWHTLFGHSSQVGQIIFHQDFVSPDLNAFNTTSSGNATGSSFTEDTDFGSEYDTISLASCSNNGEIKLWSINSSSSIADLDSCVPYRVPRLQFHPSGRFLGLACYDHSWRFWDLSTQQEILHQEGHSSEVFEIAFHPDGSLVATGGLDGYGRIWDLRSGRCVMFAEGHIISILSIDWHCNGYHFATGGGDNSCKIWDLRSRKCIYTLPSHDNLVSRVKFFHNEDGGCLVTASYDATIKIWSHPVWLPFKTLSAHNNKVLGLDVSHDNNFIASSGFDKTFKIWSKV